MISAAIQSATLPTAAAGKTPAAHSSAVATDGGSFATLFGAGARQVRQMEAQAQSTVVDLLRGGGVEVHDAMIATQQSELTFELALQVRNKAVAAYQQMMQMQF